MIVQQSLRIIFSRHYQSSALRKLTNIRCEYKPRAIEVAKQALMDYLHFTKLLPFVYAEHISNNALNSLINTIVTIDYSSPTFPKSVSKLFRYNPINEFEFFFESIGIEYSKVGAFLPADKFFFDEDDCIFNAACALSSFGFPWTRLGILYSYDRDIFRKGSAEITSRLYRFKEKYGFGNVTVIGICLAFPYVLSGQGGELKEEVVTLFSILKRVFVDYNLISCVEGNVDAWYEVCRKVRLFYDLMDNEKGKVGDLMGMSKHIFLDYREESLVQKVEFFCGFSADHKEDMGQFILRCPEILISDLETRVISVDGLLRHFGMSVEELKSVSQKYPYVFGRNKIANLPHIMRALDRQEWFLNKIKNGNHRLLANYELLVPDEDLDKEFREYLEKVQTSRYRVHTMLKINFVHRIGFGENSLTIKVLHHLHGTSDELQNRFNCLLDNGLEFSKISMLIKKYPKILNQKPDTLRQKLRFLREDMRTSLECLDVFPGFLCFDLENRIKPRYRFHTWLTDNGLSIGKSYSIASLVSTSEKNFVARLYGIHPAAPKWWFECFSCRRS